MFERSSLVLSHMHQYLSARHNMHNGNAENECRWRIISDIDILWWHSWCGSCGVTPGKLEWALRENVTRLLTSRGGDTHLDELPCLFCSKHWDKDTNNSRSFPCSLTSRSPPTPGFLLILSTAIAVHYHETWNPSPLTRIYLLLCSGLIYFSVLTRIRYLTPSSAAADHELQLAELGGYRMY